MALLVQRAVRDRGLGAHLAHGDHGPEGGIPGGVLRPAREPAVPGIPLGVVDDAGVLLVVGHRADRERLGPYETSHHAPPWAAGAAPAMVPAAAAPGAGAPCAMSDC